jgi:hypothetical protein
MVDEVGAGAPDPEEVEPEEFDPDIEDTPVEEPAGPDQEGPVRFVLSSYGWDSDVEGLVKRMNRGDIYVPGYQRGFVWTGPEKSRFIESLILGLPVPNVFLAREAESQRLNIVDGQQRLRTLQQYLAGGFALSGKDIQPDLVGCYFSREVAKSKKSKILKDGDNRTLSDALVHSVVIKPDPADDDDQKGHEYNRAVIQIFRRLNTSGKPLQAQEIRASIFHGPFNDMLLEMNANADWRALWGPVHSRLRDVETILRYVALLTTSANYRSPMPKFLDDFMENNRLLAEAASAQIKERFADLTHLLLEQIGVDAFKQKGTFVLSRFDAVAVGLATALDGGADLGAGALKEKWDRLMNDEGYQWATLEFVNDTDRVKLRLERAIEIFGG